MAKGHTAQSIPEETRAKIEKIAAFLEQKNKDNGGAGKVTPPDVVTMLVDQYIQRYIDLPAGERIRL